MSNASRGLKDLPSCPDIRQLPQISPTVTKAPVVDLEWLQDNTDQHVLAITKKMGQDAGGVWYSSDGAKTWEEKTVLLNSTLQAGESLFVNAVFSSKSDPKNVVLLGNGLTYWTSNDFGATYTARQTPTKWKGMSIKSYKQHPHNEAWLLVLVKRPACRTMDHMQQECPFDLVLTRDLFSGNPNWTNLTANANSQVAGFVDFDWGSNLCPGSSAECSADMRVREETILATIYQHPGDYDQPWDPDVHFVMSNNWFSSFDTQVKCGNMFEIIGRTVYLAVANSCPVDPSGRARKDKPQYPQGITLYTSLDGGNTFTQACLPVALKQEGYELLQTHDGSGAIIIVDFLINNGYMDIPASSVYTAGPHHALFSLSLTDVYHADFGFGTDFARVEGLPGVYIANQMLPSDDSGAEGDYGYDLSDSTSMPLVETRITFNGGGAWQRIPAPSAFRHAFCDRCDGRECYLHLHGMSSWDSVALSVPAVYSNPSAPGIIMASGNTAAKGDGLDSNDGLCTWLSTDGGVSWVDVAVGAYIYEYADWGGLIVMATHPGTNDKPAEEVKFSWDYGRCWQSVPLSEALMVDNIRIEPDGQRPRVVVHGRRCRKGMSDKCFYGADDKRSGVAEGLMYLVDIQELLGAKPLPACLEADREQWYLPNASSPVPQARCVLGKQMYVQRRKPSSTCLNGAEYKRPQAVNQTCGCTVDADLECDYGWLRTTNECRALPRDRMPTCPVVDSGTYTVSSTGKRLVHGDVCTGVDGVIPDTDGKGGSTGGSPTPAPSPSGGGGKKKGHSGLFKFLMFLLVVCVLAAAFMGWWRILATDAQRDTCTELAWGMLNMAVDVLHVAHEKLRALWARVRGGHDSYTTAPQEQDLGYFQPLGDGGPSSDDRNSLFTLK
eukprot:CAMPEP_0202867564 /NCGR_PEP_ID=MMETSP1391-20130828/9502_1 /ASSEMBLY_ACC=CAM_ASM_000867 /TAXON_ID=1034604 /ORGANISM="Chlamydomonas leiostraca, Strain SAG 11-49" /LENGTH=890 /DNA_ID=CAMNT_0049547617 /DNA_START=70 /DNA_END=2742 /DNA_ORIENTATION=-